MIEIWITFVCRNKHYIVIVFVPSFYVSIRSSLFFLVFCLRFSGSIFFWTDVIFSSRRVGDHQLGTHPSDCVAESAGSGQQKNNGQIECQWTRKNAFWVSRHADDSQQTGDVEAEPFWWPQRTGKEKKGKITWYEYLWQFVFYIWRRNTRRGGGKNRSTPLIAQLAQGSWSFWVARCSSWGSPPRRFLNF